jgi:tetratricopeptide (TPR) repeat protein
MTNANMKKLFITAIVCLLLNFSTNSQTNIETNKETLQKLNQLVMESSKAGKLDDSAEFARQTLALTVKMFGEKAVETAVSYYNLGFVYLAKKDYKKAVENLEKALDIYQQNPERFAQKIANTAQSLGVAYGYSHIEKKAEENLMLAFNAAQKFYGSESKSILPYLTNLRNFYVFNGDFNKADSQYINQFLLTARILGKGSEELEKIEDEHYCFVIRFFTRETAKLRLERFKDATKEGREAEDVSEFTIFPDDDKNNVVNGKAVSLARPNYPAKARAKNAAGLIPVKVLIDEAGKVIEAKTFCGNPDLREVSEKAALKSKFSPTTFNGKPIKVSGVIIYNFVFQK